MTSPKQQSSRLTNSPVTMSVTPSHVTWRTRAQKLQCYIYVELVAVGAAVGCDSVSSRWRFNMHSVSFEFGREA